MRRIGDLMKDLGFDKKGSEETQKAFIKHLVKAAQISEIDRKKARLDNEPKQLCFEFLNDDNGIENPSDKKPKAVG